MLKPTANRLILCLLLLICWGVLPTIEVQAEVACIECHEKLTTAFAGSFHGRAFVDKGFDCAVCHGNPDRHLDDPGRENIVAFGKKASSSKLEQNRLCLECHESSPQVSLWEMSRHGRDGLACVDCHTMHSRTPQVNQPEVCYKCHGSIRMAANKISHHPFAEGKIKCSDCHNSHGSLTPAMLVDDTINQLCYGCHADKRGPFIREHPPVEENCATCHDPHGSRHENLMKEKTANLCQNCHNPGSLHANRPYDERSGFAAAGRAKSIGFAGRSCLNCHSKIHGSTHFNDGSLTR